MKSNDIKTTWDLSYFYKSDDDPQIEIDLAEVEAVNMAFAIKWKDRDDYLKDPKVLKEALDELEAVSAKYSVDGRPGYYFYLRGKQEQDNPQVEGRQNRLMDSAIKLVNETSFFTNRLSKVPNEVQNKFLEAEDLLPYKHYLESLFAVSRYILSEEEEKIINLFSKTSYSNWESMLSKFISKEEREVIGKDGKPKTATFEEIMTSLSSTQKDVRDRAAEALNEVLEKHSDTAESEINSILEFRKVVDELKGYTRPDQERHVSEDIDSEVVDAMLEAVSSHYQLAHDFYKLKAKVMGVEKLKYHEKNVPVGSKQVAFKYDQSLNVIFDTFKKIDPEFESIAREFSNKAQIDVYPRKGKSTGGVCIAFVKDEPGFILVNFTDELEDTITVAHELGHAINHELMKKQNALNYSNSLAVAEVASNFFQDAVLQTILADADEELRFTLLMKNITDTVNSTFRQVACYKFEQDLHARFREKGYLSKQEIGEIFSKNMSAYMGEYISQDEGSENWWIYWSHIRTYFYVYSYASGILIAKSLLASYNADPSFVEKIKEFLSAGSSSSPKDIFANMGIDITDKSFWEKGLNETRELLVESEALAKKLGKI